MPGSFAFLFLAGAVATLTAAAEVRVPCQDVYLTDVASVSGAGDGSGFLIARLPRAGASIRLSKTQLAALVRRRIPGLEVDGGLKGGILIRSMAAVESKLERPVYVAEAPLVDRHQKLTLTSTSGPVTIERPVVALQRATKRDSRIFVRTSDGAVMSVPLWAAGAE